MSAPSPSDNGFRPLWLLRNRHVQTILGHLLSGPPVRHPTQKHRVPVSDGDQLVLHDSIPEGWRPGDRIRPLGMDGSKTLQDLFTDRKVPRSLRHQLPVIAAGDRVAWVAGVAVSEDFRLDPDTSAAVVITARVAD